MDGVGQRLPFWTGTHNSPSDSGDFHAVLTKGHVSFRDYIDFRIVLIDDSDTPVVTLYEGGRPRVTMGLIQQSAVLNMAGSSGARVVVGVAGNDRPSVTIVDSAGQVIGELP